MKATWGMVGLFVGALGCGGSASLVLKTPVSNECQKASLQGCDEIAEGVLLYVEGRKGEGAIKLRTAAQKNSPEKIQSFAAVLGTLSRAPGAGKYADAIHEVMGVLTSSGVALAEPASRSPDGAAASAGSTEGAGVMARGSSHRILTADTDAAQVRSDYVSAPTNSPAWCTQLFGTGAACVMLARGPLFLTDVAPSSAECQGQLLAVLEEGRVRGQLQMPLRVHGARIFVSSAASLVLVQRAQPEGAAAPGSLADGAVVLDETSPDWSCSLYFSGFVPYEVAAPKQPPRDWTQESGF
jgi:hypothetical protein